ncbi:uncharacterized protein LOC132144849 [Carassius carassius]|uniref:uncharacterized protein LOC132144849 n=1 Tax=Carassius carassius TaxID=217509 RepID=UPI0028695995|nr:uncharacterized protein LOC132144849 [Carassius carassius]
MAFLLSSLVLLLGVLGTNSLWTVSKITAQSGGSVTIPCHYHWLHKNLEKFWFIGKNWLSCLKLRPTNQEKRPGISYYNNPDELVTTLTMTNLRSSDSNRYWCAVQTRGSYLRISLELTVTEGTPDLSAASNMVSGEEGGNVTVQCLYSDKFKNTERKWCRSGDLHSCQTAQDIEPSLGAAQQINDTNDGVYTVTLTGLKKKDAGWYWCMAGDVQVPVHINVDSRQPITDANTRPFMFTTAQSFTSSNSFDVHNHNSGATLAPTQSKLPESTSVQTEKTDQTSSASPEQFHSTTQSSSYPTTMENSKHDPSHSSSTVRTTLTSRSTTLHVDSNSTVFSTTAATLTAYAPKRKKTVYILSSMHSVIQTDNTTKRKPNTVTLYNTTKCGMDVIDQMVREYTVRTGTRRWPVAMFYNMIDMAALNAHVLYQACTGRQERWVDFLVELARKLANSHMCAKKARKEQLLRAQPSTPSPGKRAMCQVKHQCKNNHATVRCVHCYRYTCGKCRREIPWQCQDCE